MHDYEIDWNPNSITWSIDGKVIRTLNRDSTWNATYNHYAYPQTPARVQLSLWPGGLEQNGQSTIDWAGGLVDWNSPYMSNGYYYATVDSVNIECYDPPEGANVHGSKSYIYNSNVMTNNTVEVTDRDTVLDSLTSTGTDPGSGDNSNNTLPIPSGTVSLMDAPTTTSSSSSTGFVQGDGDGSSSGLTTGAKVGIGVGVPVVVIIAGSIAGFLILRRRRRSKQHSSAPGRRGSSEKKHEKPELEADFDPRVAGPVKPKSELPAKRTVKRKPVLELSAGWTPSELQSKTAANAPWSHSAGGYVPPELQSTDLVEAGTSTEGEQQQQGLNENSDTSKSGIASSTAAASSFDPGTSRSPLIEQSTTTTSQELAEEADTVVQELGLVSMRKKTLQSEATAKGVAPEALEGRKGKEYQRLLGRESSLRERLDEIENERAGVQ